MQNLGLILRLAKRIAPGMDVRAIGAEIRNRIEEELDYELEAQNQRTLHRIFRGHPFIVVPAVVSSLSRERVLVSEFVAGTKFEVFKTSPQEEKDRIAEMIYRFYFGCLYRHHQFSGDPHPGNSLLLKDGRMAFLDFGLFKRMPAGAVELEMAVARAIIEGDKDTIMRLGTETGFFPEPEKFDPDLVLEHFRAATSWYTEDAEVELTPEYATQVLIDMSDPRSDYFGQLRHESAPPDHIFGRRMEVLTLAVLGQLHARGNFHRIAREWFYGDPPATELGAAEAEFYAQAAA
jgi:predicted unusual protein kinase regulating ubiquinone biosynthesis (AarF/ABC1/UbiB family)